VTRAQILLHVTAYRRPPRLGRWAVVAALVLAVGAWWVGP
jgi:hypothetical protein